MKKLLSFLLALSLCLALALSCAAEDAWADYTCTEQQFSTKIPVSGTSQYNDTAKGIMIYTDVPGYIPYVVVSRRPPEMKFSNPANYLNNVYREYIENTYGDDCLGMNPAKTWEIGGKELLGARYMYRIGDYTVVQLQLIEVREAGDVEYTAKFIEGEDAATMAALNEAVRYYQETDAAPAEEGPALPEDVDAATPSFLVPKEFVSNFNALISALADNYAEQLGEDGVKTVKEEYTITREDIQGTLAYYGNRDWSIEVAYIFPDEGSVSYTAPGLQLNFNMKNSLPDTVRDFALYTFRMIIAYEYLNDVEPDDLAAWFDSAEEPSDVFSLPGYTLNVLKSEEYTQYAILIPADRNPFKPE